MTASPIFIVGCPRSGTTLLRDLLRSHPRLTFPPESHFIPAFYRGYGDPGSAKEAVDLATRLLRLEWIRQWDIALTPGDFVEDRSFDAVVCRLFDAWARTENKPRWGDKTPHYIQNILTLVELFPSARVIHIVRDGRDVALSWLKAGFEPRNLYTAATLWKRYVSTGRRAGMMLPLATYLEVRYESMLGAPADTMRAVCDFVGESYTDAVLTQSPILRVLRPKRLGKPRPAEQPIAQATPASVARWKTAMSAGDQLVFESVAGDLLATLDYETAGVTRPISRVERLGWKLHHTFWWVLERLNLKGFHRWFLTDLAMRRAHARARRRKGLKARSLASDKIRIIYTAHSLDVGGAEKVALDLMRHIDPERFQIIFLVREAENRPTTFDLTIRRVEERGMIVVPTTKPGNVISAVFREYALYRAIRPRIIHLHLVLGFEPFAKKLIARAAGIPVVVTTYHQFPVSHRPSAYRPDLGFIDRARKRLMDFLTLWGMRRIDDAMIATSEEEKQAHIATGVPGGKIAVISNGIDLGPYQNPPTPGTVAQLKSRLGIPTEAFVFGHVGRLNLQKAQRYLVAAAASVLKEFPEAFLVMIGEGEDRAALFGQISATCDAGVRRRILLPGEVRDTDMASWYAMFDVFVMASRFEGQGLVNMEAMAAGRPIVATRVGGVPSTVGDDAAILVEPEDAEALAAAMRKLAADPGLRRRMGEAGRRRAFSRFDVARSARSHQELYRKLLDAKA